MSAALAEPEVTATAPDPMVPDDVPKIDPAKWQAAWEAIEAARVAAGMTPWAAKSAAFEEIALAVRAEFGCDYATAERALGRERLHAPSDRQRWATLPSGDRISIGSTAPLLPRRPAPLRPKYNPARLVSHERHELTDLFMDAILKVADETEITISDLPADAMEALHTLKGGGEALTEEGTRARAIALHIPLGAARLTDHRAVVVTARSASRQIAAIAVRPLRTASPRPDDPELAAVWDAIGAEEEAILSVSDAWNRMAASEQSARRAHAFRNVVVRVAAARGQPVNAIEREFRDADIY